MTSRAASAGSGRWARIRPRRGSRSGGGHGPDERALVADERVDEAEVAGVRQGARGHPAGHDRDRDAAGARRADRRDRPRPRTRSSPISVPSRSSAISPIGNAGLGGAGMPDDAAIATARLAAPRDRRSPAPSREDTRGRPARSGSTVAAPARQDGGHGARSALALVGADLEQRHPVGGERRRAAARAAPGSGRGRRCPRRARDAARTTPRSAGRRSRRSGRRAGWQG